MLQARTVAERQPDVFRQCAAPSLQAKVIDCSPLGQFKIGVDVGDFMPERRNPISLWKTPILSR